MVAEHLFAAHRDGLTRYLTRVVGHPDTARDLTQEVFLRVARSGIPAETGAGHRAWVFKIARNLALNHLRDARRQPGFTTVADPSGQGTQELSAALQQALATLTDVDRDVFLLRELAGLGYDEIAVASDLSVDAVRSRLHRARQLLREQLGSVLTFHQQRGVRLTQGQ